MFTSISLFSMDYNLLENFLFRERLYFFIQFPEERKSCGKGRWSTAQNRNWL